jgi:N utilization substance protein B
MSRARSRRAPQASAKLSAARLAAVQALYQGELRKSDAEHLVAEFRRHRLGQDIDGAPAVAPDEELFAEIVRGVEAHGSTLDDAIRARLPANWPFERLEVILRAILRAAAYELASRLTTPARAVIDEYVEVGHAFFSGSEPGMINGILDALARQFRPGELERGRDGGRQAS